MANWGQVRFDHFMKKKGLKILWKKLKVIGRSGYTGFY